MYLWTVQWEEHEGVKKKTDPEQGDLGKVRLHINKEHSLVDLINMHEYMRICLNIIS